jgi:hypothetical protein
MMQERIAETMLHTAGRAVVVRVRQAASSPPMEAVLKPCLLKVSGEAAEMLVAASALCRHCGIASGIVQHLRSRGGG